jgi:hypothetical protein
MLLLSVLVFGCKTNVEKKFEALEKPIHIVVFGDGGAILRGSKGGIANIPNGFYVLKEIRDGGLKVGDVFTPSNTRLER